MFLGPEGSGSDNIVENIKPRHCCQGFYPKACGPAPKFRGGRAGSETSEEPATCEYSIFLNGNAVFCQPILGRGNILQKIKSPGIAARASNLKLVVWAGIEPATQGFSVLCSTD